MNTDLIVLNPKLLITLLSNHEIKVMNATAKIIPGIAQPEIEKVFNISKNLLFETLLPQFAIKAKEINTIIYKKTHQIVFKNNSIIFKSDKCFGKIIVQ